ncbi:hypothetical protein HPB49_019367 [Dermacentor silvarum]|uniref:Uncharacterized protein n=1 Tax=Dermacentor silvarum TaxID=543639 RepID=A0ACB8CZ86_DERSI|nr:hypothetical protein HPB49_019367 [Dermacentor silvarum]
MAVYRIYTATPTAIDISTIVGLNGGRGSQLTALNGDGKMAASVDENVPPATADAAKRFVWTRSMTDILINIWEDYLPHLRAHKHNAHVYDAMTEDFNKAAGGTSVTTKQLRHKIENLGQQYRQKGKTATGSAPVSWPYYSRLHRFLGSLPANDLSLVEESLQVDVVTEAEDGAEVIESWEARADTPHIVAPEDGEVSLASQAALEPTTRATPDQGTHAVPSKFPNHSRKTARREDPDSKRLRIENAALQKAIAESNEAFIRAREEDKVNSTDCLEDRLGKYRQLAGAQYHISIRQIYEVENKVRLQSTLPTVSPDQHWECVRKQVEALLPSSEEQSDFDTCENGHTVELVLKHILRCSTNILLKNFCRKLNDKLLDAADKSKKRKATTLEAK